MTNSQPIASKNTMPLSQISVVKPPSYIIECGFFATIFYAFLGHTLGVTIPLFGAALLAVLAALCVLHFGQVSGKAFKPVALALACGISALLIQLAFHEESLLDDGNRTFVTWILSLIDIQSLCFRKGFLHRFAIVSFMIGLCTLPFLKVYGHANEVARIGTSGTGLANPNAFATWFGFCAVYFMIAGLRTRNYIVRLASWSAGLLCFYLVGITVSRGSLLGVLIALTFAFRKMLKSAFFPILVLLFVGWLIYLSGILDDLIGSYLERGAEETGRTYLWSAGLGKFLDAWWGGVGISNSKIPLPNAGFETSLHNGLLFIAVSSGILPLAFFVGYLVRAAGGAFRASSERTPDAPFILPLFIFAFLSIMLSAQQFQQPWPMVAFSMALAFVPFSETSRRNIGEVVADPSKQQKP